MAKAYPSLLSADFSKLGDEIAAVESAGADGIHFDVMDGHFVPNLSFGAPVLKCIRTHIKTEADCHLMVTEPAHLFESYAKAGADRITIHIEACQDVRGALQKINQLGMRAGLSVKPKTPWRDVIPFLDLVDLILIMTVEPGFGGQKIISQCLDKVSDLRAYLTEQKLTRLIQVDGGIDGTTCAAATRAGADILVAGSYVFGSPDYRAAIKRIQETV